MSPSHNSSSSGSGLVSPTGVTLTLSGSHDNNSLLAGRQSNCVMAFCFLSIIICLVDIRPGDRHSNYAADMLSSSTPVHREQLPSRSHVSYCSDHVTYCIIHIHNGFVIVDNIYSAVNQLP